MWWLNQLLASIPTAAGAGEGVGGSTGVRSQRDVIGARRSQLMLGSVDVVVRIAASIVGYSLWQGLPPGSGELAKPLSSFDSPLMPMIVVG